ncbi:MAG: UbiA family prenyltransferase [Methanospirillaceae archaeon]|nr:UbiA family prenyltransferase [Methanospirillaceae archaeon]
MILSPYLVITRPVNAVVAGLAGILAFFIATGTVTPVVFACFLMIACITAAGNVINDYFDVAIDAINRPQRPIPAGLISKNGALWYAVLLFFVGNAIGLYTGFFIPFCIGLVNSILLVLYAWRLKSMPVLGNIAVSYLSASIFLFGGAFAGLSGVMANIAVSGATFFVMMTREILKDCEDVAGDAAGGAVTLAIKAGIPVCSRIALLFSLLGVATSLVLYFRWGVWYLFGIIPVDLLLITGSVLACNCSDSSCIRKKKSTTILKAGMFASLVIFTLSAYLF